MEVKLNFLNYIISFLIGFAPLAEEDGWFPVEQGFTAQEQVEEGAAAWTFFSKTLGSEKFLVRFPEEPTYLYTVLGDLKITSQKEGEQFQLTVQQEGEPREDLLYLLDGKWVREHFVQTDSHFYHFKTLSERPNSPAHQEFISSFSIEQNT